MHEAVKKIHENSAILLEEAPKGDKVGQLTDRAAAVLRESGGIRLLQCKESGGYEANPQDFFEWVRAVGQYSPSAGWIAGVVGIHPWEVALMDPRLQEEIYGSDPDTWTASPYAPLGRAKPVEGGFLFTGEWPYSTGTDHCDWIILGGIVTDAEGNVGTPPDLRHFVLPRADYEIVEDSWHVMGLAGTGSKNVRMKDVFIPEYRVVEAPKMIAGEYVYRQEGKPLYGMAFGVTFALAISSATLGIIRGMLDAYRDYLKTRVSAAGVVGLTDPFQQQALAEAESDWETAVLVIDNIAAEMMAAAEAGQEISKDDRLRYRRNQVRAIQNAITSANNVYARAGSSAVWTDRPLERYWRDLQAGASHVCNVYDTAYTSWANYEFQTGGLVNTPH